MTFDQVAFLLSLGVSALLVTFYVVGLQRGARRATKVIGQRLEEERAARFERWTPPPPQPSGEPGTPERLLSDYEDSIYLEARHALAAQVGTGDEQEHAALAAQLHGDVR